MPRKKEERGTKSIFATLPKTESEFGTEFLQELEADDPGALEFIRRMGGSSAPPEAHSAVSISLSSESLQTLNELSRERGMTRSRTMDELLKAVKRARRGTKNT